MPYYTGLKTSFDNATISVDSANDRVGIGTVAPAKKLDVVGSVGISTTLDVTGNTTLTGDLAVNGGDITTTSTTGNLFNATVTTLNLASVATAVSVGSASAVITVPSTTDATNSTTGSIKTAGGVGIAKKLYVGTDLSVGAALTVTGKATSVATVSGDGSTTLVTKGYAESLGPTLIAEGDYAFDTDHSVNCTANRPVQITINCSVQQAGETTIVLTYRWGRSSSTGVFSNNRTIVNYGANYQVIASPTITSFIPASADTKINFKVSKTQLTPTSASSNVWVSIVQF